MPRPVTVTISHELGKDEARKRLDEGFAKFKSALTGGFLFSFTKDWTSPDQLTFTARGAGQTITGKIDVFPEHVRIEATLPNLLASVAEVVTSRVERQGQILLEKK